MLNNNGHNPDVGNAELVILDNGEIIAVYTSWKFAYMDLAELEKYQPSGRYQVKRANFIRG